MSPVYGIIIALTVVIILLGMLVVGLLRSHADILRKLDSLGAGLDGSHDHGSGMTLTRRPATDAVTDRVISGLTPHGEAVVISLASSSDPTLLAFLSTTCSTCTPFWEGLNSSWMHFGAKRHRVIAVTMGESEESPTRALSLAAPGLDVVMSSTAWAEFEVPGAPYFVVVEPGTLTVAGEGSAMTFESLEEFLTDATNDATWDLAMREMTADEESRIDSELRRAGLLPGDPRLYHQPGDIEGDSD